MQDISSFSAGTRRKKLEQAAQLAREIALDAERHAHSRGLHLMEDLRARRFSRAARHLFGVPADEPPVACLGPLACQARELRDLVELAGRNGREAGWTASLVPSPAEMTEKTVQVAAEAHERSLGPYMKALHCLKTAYRHPFAGLKLMFDRVVRHIPVNASPLDDMRERLATLERILRDLELEQQGGLLGSFRRTLLSHRWKGVWIIGSLDMGWHEKFKQRHHHLAEFLMKNNYLVLCAMNPVYEADRTAVLREVPLRGMPKKSFYLVNFNDRTLFRNILELVAVTFDGPVFYSLMPTEPGTTPADLDFLKSLGVRIYYDYFDELSRDIYPGITDMQKERHERLLRDPDVLICTTAPNLYRKAVSRRKENVILSRNAVSPEDWSLPPDAPVPPEMEAVLRLKRKIVGFYGSFAPWLDYAMLKALAVRRPDLQLVMIGYDYEWGRGAFAASGLAGMENVTIIPEQKYSDLKYFSRFFDVCVIPFRLYELTKSVSPVKMFEYMAQGKPVVASPLPECKRYKSCLIARTPDDFVRQIDLALTLANDEAYLAVLRKEAAANTWKQRGIQIMKFLESAVRAQRSGTAPLLTIAVPAYNMEQYLPVLLGKLESEVLLKRIELLIVNDGSHDGTLRIAREAARKHPGSIRVIDKENGGHGSCINAGIRHASGRFFKLIDADDYPDPAALLMHLNFLERHDDADMVVCDYRRVYTDGSTMDISYADRLREGEVYTPETLWKALSLDRTHLSFVHMHAITWRTGLLREANLRITEHSFYVDQEYITYPLPFVKKILRQNIFLYHYLMGRPGQSVDPETARKRSGMNWNILQKILAFRDTLSGEHAPVLREYLLNLLFHQSWFFLSFTDDPDRFSELMKFWSEQEDRTYCEALLRHFSPSLRTRDLHLKQVERFHSSALARRLGGILTRVRLPHPSART